MAILKQVSVGDIMYYYTDDVPNHLAPKGSISIVSSDTYDNGFIYVNNNGGNVWVKCIRPSYGGINITNNTTGVSADGTQALLSWYAFFTGAWELDNNEVYTLTNNYELKYTGDTLIKTLSSVESTMRAGDTKWISWEVGVSKNFTIPNKWNEGFGNDNAGTTNIGSFRVDDTDIDEFYLAAISPITRESGGGTTSRTYIPRHSNVTSLKLDEAYKERFILEDWESSGFTENSWTVVNDTTNVWVIGTAENNGGSYSAYISDDGGTSASYTITTSNISHFYKDFVLPSGYDKISLSFNWKCQGENAAGVTQYDYGAVVITTTGTTPVAGTEVTTTQTEGAATTRLGATDNSGKFNLNYGTTPGSVWNSETIDLSDYGGETKRLVFTWVNDGSVGTDPPFVLDNIKIIGYKYYPEPTLTPKTLLNTTNVYWLDFTDVNNITVDTSGNTQSVTDKFDNGYDFEQTDASIRPPYISSGDNYVFLNDSSRLDSVITVDAITGTNKMSICFVAELNEDESGDNGIILEISDNFNSYNDALLCNSRQINNDVAPAYRDSTGGGGGYNQVKEDWTNFWGKKKFVTVVYDKSQATSTDAIKIYTNGELINNQSVLNASNGTTNWGNYNHYIGARLGQTGPLLGNMWELWTYADNITESQVKQLYNDYVKEKYGDLD